MVHRSRHRHGEDERMEKSPLRLSEGLVVAALPAYGYLLAYLYQRGFANELNIPYEFIQVGLSDVLLIASSAFFILIVLVRPFADLGIVVVGLLPKDPRWRAASLIVLVWFTVNMAQLLIYRHNLEKVWPVMGITAVFTLAVIWLPFSSTPQPTSSVHHLGDRLGRPVMFGLFAASFIAIGAGSLGEAKALDQREFLVVSSTNEAVLAIYGQTAVLAPHVNHQLQDRFRLADVSGLDVERRRIGPLKAPEEEES